MEPREAAVVGGVKAVDAYRKALASAASAAAYAVMARGMARELLPEELRAAARWAASALGARVGWGQRDRRTLVVRSQQGAGGEYNLLFEAARTYLASRLDPRALRRLGVTLARARNDVGGDSWRRLLFLEPGDSTTDAFEGVLFTWTCVESHGRGSEKKASKVGQPAAGGDRDFVLELSFDAQHVDVAMDRYVPFVMEYAGEVEQRDRALMICMNEGRAWYKVNHHHPATFDTLAMDPELKRSIVDDLDLFKGRRDHYRRIGKAWKRGYLLYGPPGTGKSSLVAAMANHLRYNLHDLDLSHVHSNTLLQWLLVGMSNKSILVIEDIDCCCDAMSREDDKPPARTGTGDDDSDVDTASELSASPQRTANKSNNNQVTLSGLLNFIDGLWSTSAEERIIVFTTNYKDRLDPALLRPGRMDRHIYMGYCGWEGFKTLARNYFLVDDHPLFPEIQELLSQVEVTPAAVSEMLLRSDDADVALRGLKDFLEEKKKEQAMPAKKA